MDDGRLGNKSPGLNGHSDSVTSSHLFNERLEMLTQLFSLGPVYSLGRIDSFWDLYGVWRCRTYCSYFSRELGALQLCESYEFELVY
jgi:hypothetical protein